MNRQARRALARKQRRHVVRLPIELPTTISFTPGEFSPEERERLIAMIRAWSRVPVVVLPDAPRKEAARDSR